MLNKEELESIKEVTKLQKDEIKKVIEAKMPPILKKVSGGLTLKEMKFFKNKKIYNLKEKEIDGERVPLTNDEIIFDVVVPLLELRNVSEDQLDDVVGSDYISFYQRVEALTNNPKLQDEVEKKN